jgi:RND family efflux transporter MFP subunit
VLLPLAVLFAGGKATLHLVETAPKAERRSSSTRNARLVEVRPAIVSSESTLVQANGTVKPARMIQLQPRVSGEVIEVSNELIPGGLFREEDLILRIDPTDYELIVRQRAGELANAESTYQLELGNQSIAQREYELLGESILEEDRDLVLRQPQLRTVEAAIDIAKAVLEKAKIDLERTTIRAPFNAMVESYDIDLGAQVATSTSLATLVGTDEYWIELSVPVDDLKWIRIPRAANDGLGSLVRLYNEAAWGPGVYRTGRVTRLAGSLEVEARMARLIVSVPDPLGLEMEHAGAPRLLINAYVNVEIEGRVLENVISVPRRLLRDGDTVWILNDENRLDIRPVTVVFRGRNGILLSGGIAKGERIVITDLAAPVAGMPLRTENDAEAPPTEAEHSLQDAAPGRSGGEG